MTNRDTLANDEVSVALVRDEILQTSSTITVNVRAGSDPDTTARAIGVIGVDGAALPAEPGRFTWAPRSTIPPGWQTFVVEAITDVNLQTTSRRIQIPFYVVETLAQFPASLRVESFTRMRLAADGFERLDPKSIPTGAFVDVLKAVNREDGMPVSLGFDQSGRELDGELQLREHRDKLVAAKEKLDDTLRQELSRLAPSDSVLIDAWFRVEEPEPLIPDRPLDEAELAAVKASELELTRRIRRRAREIVEDIQKGLPSGVVTFENPEDRVPVLTLRVPSEFVRRVAGTEAINAVYFHDESVVLDLADSISVARSQHVHLAGRTGVGVRVAVWETAPDQTSNLFTSASFKPLPTTTNVHSTVVHEIIRNNGINSPFGHAPGCDLYSANSTKPAALTWAVDQECSVINQSFHRGTEASSGTPSSYDLRQDYLASHWPFPLIVNAAGNLDDGEGIMPPDAEYVNHKGYNTLSVGNHDESFWIDSQSAFRNPSSLHGDRELPELSANGTSIVAESLSSSGTSFAAPAVSGVAALIQETATTLVHWPEGCRAILLAAAGPRHRARTWWQDIVDHVDGVDGAGALNAEEGFEVAKRRSAKNAVPTPRGWDVGELQAKDFGESSQTVFNYQLSVPKASQPAPRIRVALAWMSLTGDLPHYWSTLDVDLDLAVYDVNNVQVGFSGSWDNSYELVDFVGVPGAVYTIKIRRSSLNVATRYGIAWTTHGRPPPPHLLTGGEGNAEGGTASPLGRSRWRAAIEALWEWTSETVKATTHALFRGKPV